MRKSYTKSPRSGAPSLLTAGAAVILMTATSGTTLAQRPRGAVQPAAHAGQRPVNNLPNPYETQRDWGTLPDGRNWGSVSAVSSSTFARKLPSSLRSRDVISPRRSDKFRSS